jgi:hypothetical protein
MLETRQRNESIENQLRQVLEAVRSQPQQNNPNPNPVNSNPTITDEEFQLSPAQAITRVVTSAVENLGTRLREDVQRQLEPVNQVLAANYQQSALQGYIRDLCQYPQFSELNKPNVAAAFAQLLIQAKVNRFDIATAQPFYYMAVGAAALGQVPNQNQQPTQNNNNPAPELIPPHLRPNTNNTPINNVNVQLPQLDDNQEKIRRERSWSHARACYAFKLISPEQYKKLEPNGRTFEGF